MINWRKYNSAMIPLSAPHVEVLTSEKEIKELIVNNNAFFARWTSNFDCTEETDFWYIIKDKCDGLEELSSNTRKSIRKGLKNVDVRLVSSEVIIKDGYEVYESAFKRYINKHSMKTKAQFTGEINTLLGNWDFWGVFNNEGKLIGYSQNRLREGFCDYSTTKFHPDYLKLRMSDVLFYTMTDYYLNELKLKYVCGGTKSILHETNIQKEYIRKFKFRKAYCQLHVTYAPFIQLVVRLLYPFKSLLKKMKFIVPQRVTAILSQEEIRRSYE